MFLLRYIGPGRKKMRYFVLFLTILFMSGAHAATRTVCASGASYTTISAAVAAASNGDTIQICAGTYNNESISVSKSNLTIQGASSSTVIVKNSDTVFSLGSAAASTKIKNLSIVSTAGYGIKTDWESTGNSANSFENLIISSSDYGVYVANGKTQTFNSVTITSSTAGGIYLDYNADGSHTFADVTVTSKTGGIEAQRGAKSFDTVTVKSSAGFGISISNKIATTFDTVTVESADQAIYVKNQDGPSTVGMSKVKATSTNDYAINIQKSGQLTFNTIEAKSSGNSAILTSSEAKGNHTFNNIYASSTNGKGMSINQGFASMKDVKIVSTGTGLEAGNSVNMSIENLYVEASSGTGIDFINPASSNSKYTLKNITINKAGGDGIDFHSAAISGVTAEGLCITSAGGYGVDVPWSTSNLKIKNSIIKGNAKAGINLNANWNTPADVSNSCFKSAPCVASNSSQHDFGGNYWEPSACSSITNVSAGSKLGSCAVQENSCYMGTGAGSAVVTVGAFNAFDTSTAGGAIDGKIKTKIAGSAITVSVVALNTAKTAVQTAFTGDVKIELVSSNTVGGSVDSTNCPSASTAISGTSQTVSFASSDAGRKSVTVPALADVYRDVRVKLTYPATGTATTVVCSSDNFAVRPSYLASVAGTDTTWATAGTSRTLGNTSVTGGNVHKAGQPFTVSATAYTAANAVAGSYAGTPTVKTVACSLPQPTCVNGTLALGTFASAGAGTGKVTSSTASYSEAGSFNLTLEDSSFASVDQNDGSTETDYTIAQSAAVSVGRFVPNNFTVQVATTPQFRTFNTTDASCSATSKRSFTYVGQSFGWVTSPTATVIAQNAAGGTTANYVNSLWKLTAPNVTETYGSNTIANTGLDQSAKGTPTIASTGNGLGLITSAATGTFKFTRGTSAVTPFTAAITLTVSVKDTSEEATNQSGGILTTNITTPQFNGSGNGIAFDGAAYGNTANYGNTFKYGRIKINNASGSDLLPLNLTVMAQAWDGSKYVLNADDYCTTTLNSLTLAAGSGSAFSTGFVTTAGSGSSSTPISYQMTAGVGKAVLSKPTGFTKKGSVKVNVATSSTLNSYLPGEEGIATFGIYKSGPIIYIREMY